MPFPDNRSYCFTLIPGIKQEYDTDGLTGLGHCCYGNTTFGNSMKQYFYGENKSSPYFEGWYFKCQTIDGQSIALIPAVHICDDWQRSASIQVITEDHAWWLDYPASSFSASRDALNIQIGKNCFSEKGMILDEKGKGLSLRGRVTFGPFQYPKSDIMGPFRRLANMECAHGVISMRHSLQGQLKLNDRILDLNEGVGYMKQIAVNLFRRSIFGRNACGRGAV